jgi:uncharacterized membrane protein YhiD involved in acid resistance
MEFLDTAGLSAATTPAPAMVVVQLLAAWVLCQAIGAVYAATFRGLSYSRSFAQALVVGGPVAAMLMLAIGDSMARGIGIVGTMALIRFRTNLRDPLDMVFIFASFGAGIACGTGTLVAGAAGTAVFLVVVSVLRFTGFGAERQSDGVLRLLLPPQQVDTALPAVLAAHCRRSSLIALREVAQGEAVEAHIQFTLLRPDTAAALLAAARALPAAQDVTVSMQEATVEL